MLTNHSFTTTLYLPVFLPLDSFVTRCESLCPACLLPHRVCVSPFASISSSPGAHATAPQESARLVCTYRTHGPPHSGVVHCSATDVSNSWFSGFCKAPRLPIPLSISHKGMCYQENARSPAGTCRAHQAAAMQTPAQIPPNLLLNRKQ